VSQLHLQSPYLGSDVSPRARPGSRTLHDWADNEFIMMVMVMVVVRVGIIACRSRNSSGWRGLADYSLRPVDYLDRRRGVNDHRGWWRRRDNHLRGRRRRWYCHGWRNDEFLLALLDGPSR